MLRIVGIIKKKAGEGEVQTTDEAGNGQELVPITQRAKGTRRVP